MDRSNVIVYLKCETKCPRFKLKSHRTRTVSNTSLKQVTTKVRKGHKMSKAMCIKKMRIPARQCSRFAPNVLIKKERVLAQMKL